MEKKLYDACLKGDVNTLEAIMREDELILARVSMSSCFNQTPLHLASMLGHFEFAKSLLSYKPEFASKLDSQDRSPLHVASANGYANIINLLLEYDQEMSRHRDEDGRIPIHLAVMNGQHASVIELIKVNSGSYGEEGTVLHLCVMYNRFNLLVRLLELKDQDLSNNKDGNGNTILHSAAALRRMQIIKYLITGRSKVEVNSVNKNGLTAFDIVEQMPKDVYTMEIKELLFSAGASRAKEINEAEPTSSLLISKVGGGSVSDHKIEGVSAVTSDNNSKPVKMWKRVKGSIFQKKKEKIDEALLVAATVIAAMAYQAAISPPGGVAGLDASENSLRSKLYDLEAAESFLSYFHPELSHIFWISNTISFTASLSVTFLYISGARLQRRILIWLIRAAMWMTLTSMTVAYSCAVEATSGGYEHSHTIYALFIGQYIWMGLILLSFIVLVYRSVRYLVTNNRATRKRHIREALAFRTPNANIV